MAMTQNDIQEYYQTAWPDQIQKTKQGQAAPEAGLDDFIVVDAHESFLRQNRVKVDGADVLDIGCGMGRWIQFFLERFAPASVTGVDYVEASVNHMKLRYQEHEQADFVVGDITSPDFDLGRRFDVINIVSVLFHIPDDEQYLQTLVNLRKHLKPGGLILTNDYLPAATYRTNMMLVRSRSEYEAYSRRAGLEIAHMDVGYFLAQHPMAVLDSDDRRVLMMMNGVLEKALLQAVDPRYANDSEGVERVRPAGYQLLASPCWCSTVPFT